MDRFHFRKGVAIIGTSIIFMQSVAYAKTDVNIISWWGYLNYPDLIQPIEKACNANIYLDEYYSNPEFLRRLRKSPYDIAIYSYTVYDTFHSLEPGSKIDIKSDIVKSYHPKIRQAYESEMKNTNTVYFQLSLTGFVWNPANIQLNETDSIESIFSKAHGKTVIVLDEHIEVLTLLSQTSLKSKRHVVNNMELPSIAGVKNLVDGTHLVITNNVGSILTKPDFAFAYTWHGEAMEKIHKDNLNYQFMIHPQLSHWSTDMLTLISDKDAAVCVAKALSSEHFLNSLTAYSYYFSPYKNTSENPRLNKLSDELFLRFESLRRLPNTSESDYEALDSEWQEMKMSLGTTP